MRQIILDTETTGLEAERGHRVIEIGCLEIVNRRRTGRTFHRYLRPDREVDPGAVRVHGLTNEFLAGQPRFAEVAAEFLEFVTGAELVIHNAAFDVGFLNAELQRLAPPQGRIADRCTVLDTLLMARKLHPGQRNSLDALCKRYGVDNSHRELHGALLDAQILLDVYLAMTGGQGAFVLGETPAATATIVTTTVTRAERPAARLAVPQADAEELQLHDAAMKAIDKASGGKTIWRQHVGN